MTGKTRGEARLLEACAEGGCPVCRCLGEDSARHLTMLLHEHVTDPEVRNTLRASRGLCNWHSGMLQGLPGAAFGTAILAADLLARERARAEALGRAGGRRRSSLTAVRQWLRRPAPPAEPARRPPRCLVCDAAQAAERRYLEALLALVEDPRFDDAFVRGDGLCVPHLTMLVEGEPSGARAAALERLVALATERWHSLEASLERFIAKHDYRARAPFTEQEGRAWRLALEILAGAPGLFGNARAARPGGSSRPDWVEEPCRSETAGGAALPGELPGGKRAGGAGEPTASAAPRRVSGAREARSRRGRSGSRSPGSE